MISQSKKILSLFHSVGEITILDIGITSDNTILRVAAKSYRIDSYECIDEINIVFKDCKKRQKKTLEKLGLTKEQIENGFDEEPGFRMISENFIQHNTLTAGTNISKTIKAINRKAEQYSLKKIESAAFDVFKESDYCGIEYDKNRISMNEMLQLIKKCIKKYTEINELEQNKYECVLNYAYYKELEYGRKRYLIYCNTSIGNIYYDLDKDVWVMTKKEKQKTGLIIENFDVDDIKRQIRQKYHVMNMSEFAKKKAPEC